MNFRQKMLSLLVLVFTITLATGCAKDEETHHSGPEPVSIGDSYQNVLDKVGKAPSGELNRDGVNTLLFGGGMVKLQGGVVTYIEPGFDAEVEKYKSKEKKK